MKIQINFNNGDWLVADLVERVSGTLNAYCKYMSDAVATDHILCGNVESWENAVDGNGVNLTISLDKVNGMTIIK